MLIKIIGCRFKNLEEIKERLELIYNKKVSVIIESESEMPEGSDYMIDYEFKPFDIHTLFYIKDNNGNYYITEI